MPIVSVRVTVTTSPTVLSNPVYGSAGDPISVVVKNIGGASVYLGGAAVQSTDGLELAAGETLAVDLLAGDVLYAVAATGTVSVAVMKLRQ